MEASKPKRGAPRRLKTAIELKPGQLEAMADDLIAQRGTRREGQDTRAAVRNLIRAVHGLQQEVEALRRMIELRDKLSSPVIIDRPWMQEG